MKSLYAPYVEAVAKEIEVTAARVGRVRVPSIYFGGGTPSLLPAELIGGLLTAVRTFFAVDDEAEVTLEANPQPQRGASQEQEAGQPGGCRPKLRALRMPRSIDRPVAPISDHEDDCSAAAWAFVCRCRATYEAARQAGFDNVNVDLIYGLPDQPVEKWRRTLERVIALQPDHISAYSLQIEPRTAMRRWAQTGRVPEPERTSYDLPTSTDVGTGRFRNYEI
jgi:oxygen-independent coproporphyrinogen-3 oxidase